MRNATAQAASSSTTVDLPLSAARFVARVRQQQEPAATAADIERSAVLSSAKVRNALTRTWGWA